MAPFLNKLTRQIDRLQSQHHTLTDRSWLVVPSGRVYLLLIILLSLAAAFANFHVRNQQFIHWESHPEKFFAGDTPLFSTIDAGYFLGIAQSLSRHGTPNDFSARRSFPDGKKYAQVDADTTPAKAPLLSTLIYWLADLGWPRETLAGQPWRDDLGRADSTVVYGMVWQVRTYLDEPVCAVLDGIGLQS